MQPPIPGVPSGAPMLDDATRDEMARLLETTPEALDAFERSYHDITDDLMTGSPFDVDARTATGHVRERHEGDVAEPDLDEVCDRIARELSDQTDIPRLPGDVTTLDLVLAMPPDVAPMLTADAMRVDIGTRAGDEAVIAMLAKWLRTGNEQYYHLFRQGLDICDLGPVAYEILSRNPASIGHWFPALETACHDCGDELLVPETRIAKVPLPILQMSRLGYTTLNPSTLDIVNRWATTAFGLGDRRDWFVKTGTYSSKFDFRNAHVTPDEEPELGSYLLYIQSQASEMAGPLTQPSIYGMSTTNEWCVREWIPDQDDSPTIYHGMPLRCEFRTFVDFDEGELLATSPYWRPDVMTRNLGGKARRGDVHAAHDYVVYKMHQRKLDARYRANVGRVEHAARAIARTADLEGQWSLDVMLDGDRLWAIDMAPADTSALNDVIPPGQLRPTEVDWVPKLPSAS